MEIKQRKDGTRTLHFDALNVHVRVADEGFHDQLLSNMRESRKRANKEFAQLCTEAELILNAAG